MYYCFFNLRAALCVVEITQNYIKVSVTHEE